MLANTAQARNQVVREAANEVAASPRLARLELVAQGKLHHARLGQRAGVEADAGGVGDGAVVGQGGRVKAHGVGQVVGVGAKAQGMPLGKAEGLVHAGIDAEEALAAEIVAGPGLAGKRQTEEAAGIGGAEIEGEGLTVDESRNVVPSEDAIVACSSSPGPRLPRA